jgi:hypothetical protein
MLSHAAIQTTASKTTNQTVLRTQPSRSSRNKIYEFSWCYTWRLSIEPRSRAMASLLFSAPAYLVKMKRR